MDCEQRVPFTIDHVTPVYLISALDQVGAIAFATVEFAPGVEPPAIGVGVHDGHLFGITSVIRTPSMMCVVGMTREATSSMDTKYMLINNHIKKLRDRPEFASSPVIVTIDTESQHDWRPLQSIQDELHDIFFVRSNGYIGFCKPPRYMMHYAKKIRQMLDLDHLMVTAELVCEHEKMSMLKIFKRQFGEMRYYVTDPFKNTIIAGKGVWDEKDDQLYLAMLYAMFGLHIFTVRSAAAEFQ